MKEFATGHAELICSVQPLWFIVGALMQLWELGMPFNPLLLQVLQSWVKEILNVALNFLLPRLKMQHFAPFRKCPSIFSIPDGALLPHYGSVYLIGIWGQWEIWNPVYVPTYVSSLHITFIRFIVIFFSEYLILE